MLEKLKTAGRKIKHKKNQKQDATLGFLANISPNVLKTLLWGAIVFNLGTTVHNVGLTSKLNSLKKELMTSISSTPAQKYNIKASRQGLVDSLSLALDDLRHINPFTRGCVEDMVAHNQRFFILPDDYTEWPAYYNNNDICIRESELKNYHRQYNQDGNPFIHDFLNNDIKTYWIYKVLLHEARHAQQARQGIILATNLYFKHGNILDFTTSMARLEADADQYADFCLYKGSPENGIQYQAGTVKADWKVNNYSVDKWYSNQIAEVCSNLHHLIKKGEIEYIKGVKETKIYHDENIIEFERLFQKLTIPVSIQSKRLEYLETKSTLIDEFNTLRKSAKQHNFDFDSHEKIIPYLSVLRIGENEDWLNYIDIKNPEIMEYFVKKLKNLRRDRNMAIKYFEDELYRQNPEMVAKRDTVRFIRLERDDR